MATLPIMEDSGIDSEDKQSNHFEELQMMVPQKTTTTTTAITALVTATTATLTTAAAPTVAVTSTSTATAAAAVTATATTVSHMADLEVVFRGSASTVRGGIANGDAYKRSETSLASAAAEGSAATTTADGDSDDDSSVINTQPAPNTCRILQRKLELKVERAKRNYSQYQQQEHVRKSQSANLIPINRLPIPGDPEQKPLVDYNSESSDEAEEIRFFPAKVKNAHRQRKTELSDTFSIQEMTIESELDSDDSGSQNLELLPPMNKTNLLDKVKNCFGCVSSSRS